MTQYAPKHEFEHKETKDDGPKRTFETGATRDTGDDKLKFDGFLSASVIKRYAEYMHKNRIQSDGSLRDPDNWQKGIPPILSKPRGMELIIHLRILIIL